MGKNSSHGDMLRGDLSAVAPVRVPGVVIEHFHFDQLTREILTLADKELTVEQIIDHTGAQTREVVENLKLLAGGGIIELVSKEPVRSDSGSESDELARISPVRNNKIDTSHFHLDPLTEKILALVDGRTSIKQIVENTGVQADEVVEKLKLLRGGGVVEMPDIQMAPRQVILPMAPDPSRLPSSRPPASTPQSSRPPASGPSSSQPPSPDLQPSLVRVTNRARGSRRPLTPPDVKIDSKPADAGGSTADGNDRLGDFGNVSPGRITGVDITNFYFDPLTVEILGLIEEHHTVKQIVEKTGAAPDMVTEKIRLLSGGGIIALPSNRPSLTDVDMVFGDLAGAIPTRVPDLDTSNFYFDPLTEQILNLVDESLSLDQIVRRTGASASVISEKIQLLKGGGIIEVPESPQRRDPTSSSPPFRSSTPAARDRASQRPSPYSRTSDGVQTGSLGNKSPEELFGDAIRKAFTGAISFEKNGDVITFHFENGMAKGVQALAEQHDHGVMLHKKGLIDDNVFDVYKSLRRENRNPITALRESGIANRREMARLIVQRGQMLSEEVLEWERGTYEIAPNVPFPDGIAHCILNLGNIKAGEKRKDVLDEEQERFLADNEPRYMVATPNAKNVIAGMGLGTKEKRYAGHVLENSPMQVRHSLSISPLFKRKTRFIVFNMIERGAFELHDYNPNDLTPIPVEELESHRNQLRKKNHFDVIGAHVTCIEEEIRSRYEQRLAETDPKRYQNATKSQLKALEEIRELIEKSFKFLSDAKQRQEYRTTIYSKFQLNNFFDFQMEKAEAALSMHDNPHEALPLALSAWDLRPKSVVANNMLADIYTALGREKEARKYRVFKKD